MVWRVSGAMARVRAAYARAHGGRLPRLVRPRRFTEKMQWRKLFDRNPLFRTFCDKLAVRDYVGRLGPGYLVPLLWQGEPADIPLASLPPPYVLKGSHGCGQALMVHGAADVADPAAVRALAAGWLAHCHGTATDEPGYVGVPRRIMAERMLRLPGGGPPEERRLFVFGGEVAVINTVFVEDGQVRNGAFHTPDWTRLDWRFTREVDRPFHRPPRLDDMLATAAALGQGVDHLRVDLYDLGDSFLVGELTCYAWSGFARFVPDAADVALGRYWRLPYAKVARRFGRAMLGAPARDVTGTACPLPPCRPARRGRTGPPASPDRPVPPP